MNTAERAALVEQIEDVIDDLQIEATTIAEALMTARRLLGKLRGQLEALGDRDAESEAQP
jgi:hypothetical protein